MVLTCQKIGSSFREKDLSNGEFQLVLFAGVEASIGH